MRLEGFFSFDCFFLTYISSFFILVKRSFSLIYSCFEFSLSNKDWITLFPVDRRLVLDDSRGVAEALNETVCVVDDCKGLIVRAIIHLTSKSYLTNTYTWPCAYILLIELNRMCPAPYSIEIFLENHIVHDLQIARLPESSIIFTDCWYWMLSQFWKEENHSLYGERKMLQMPNKTLFTLY